MDDPVPHLDVRDSVLQLWLDHVLQRIHTAVGHLKIRGVKYSSTSVACKQGGGREKHKLASELETSVHHHSCKLVLSTGSSTEHAAASDEGKVLPQTAFFINCNPN